MTLQHERPPLQSLAQARADFLGQILTITGDTRFLWTPVGSDTTTATDKSLNARTITWDATVAARLSRLGLGYAQSFSGSGQVGTAPDAADLSFGDASNDSAFSIVALINVTTGATQRGIVSKFDNSAANEYFLRVTATTNLLTLTLQDQSVPIGVSRNSSAAITVGGWTLVGVSYDGTGGSAAADNVTMYENGLVKASTASNGAGTYVAMENLGSVLRVGAYGVNYFAGQEALVLICAKELTASEHWAIKNLVNGYFGLSL